MPKSGLFFVILNCWLLPVMAQDISGEWLGHYTAKKEKNWIGFRIVIDKQTNGIVGMSYTLLLEKKDTAKCVCRLGGTYDVKDSMWTMYEVQIMADLSDRYCTDRALELQNFKLQLQRDENGEIITGYWSDDLDFGNRKNTVYLTRVKRKQKQNE